uniref:Uncharacterized protein n=1 Tax=Sphaeramia orbicularis TaxID=375764 RepID=A0A672ZQM4_9TELE
VCCRGTREIEKGEEGGVCKKRERRIDKTRARTMSSALPYDSLSARPSPSRQALDWEREQLAVRRLSSPRAVTAWGFLGCLGVAANLPCVLRAYGFFQLAALIAGLAAGLSAVAGYTEDEGRADALDSLQRALECCGAEGWRDWLSSDWAIQHMAFPSTENGTSVSLPDSCCIRHDNEGVVIAGIHPHGCFRKVFSLVNDNVFHIAATVLGLAFTQIGGIALACLLANRMAPRQHRRVVAH